MAKAIVYLKVPMELVTGSYNILYGTPVFNSPPPGLPSADFVTIGTLSTGIYVSIRIDNIANIIWEDSSGLLDAIISSYIDDSGVLGYVALS